MTVENMKLMYLCCVLGTFILTVLFTRIMIPILKSHKMGQKILDIGPRWHKSKEGTPTMGGIAFIVAMTIILTVAMTVTALSGKGVPIALVVTFVYALACAFIGCIDDTAKLIKQQNEGLKPRQKLILQVIAAGAYVAVLVMLGIIGDDLYIPFFGVTIENLGLVYYLFIVFMLVGMVNSVNITDGVDGLASTETLCTACFFIAVAVMRGEEIGEYSFELGLLGCVMAGGMLGFLVYNFHPARVFMGDTGSLFLGALVMGGAVLMDNPLLAIVFGFIFVIESCTSLLQTTYSKFTGGKRLFKMAPIHHHFEKCGWGEIKIVAIFSSLTIIFCVAAYFGLRTLY